VSTPWLSVVVPAYNEQATIVEAIATLRGWLDSRGRAYEILVVDNASEDATVARLAPLVDGSTVRLLTNEINRGKGYSVRRGMLAARGELRLHCDADCYPSLPCLPALAAQIEVGADVAVGSRLAAGARVGRRQTLVRRVVGRSFVDLCRLVLREPTRDLFCGFKLWRAEAAEATFSRVALEGWTFDAEALALARGLGFTVREVGIEWTDREGSRLVMRRVFVPVLRELVAARKRVRRECASEEAIAVRARAAASAESRS
jgi:glycosyltransferase involved in cell wall biosynthesis